MSPFIVTGIILSLLSHVLDQGTDIFAVVLFYFEGNIWASVLTLLIFLLEMLTLMSERMPRYCPQNKRVPRQRYQFLDPRHVREGKG